jgi:hypothetical protein
LRLFYAHCSPGKSFTILIFCWYYCWYAAIPTLGPTMPLTAIQVKSAKATDKPTKLSDGGGLFLLVQPNGAKYWRLAYRFAGKQKTLALGTYPDITLLNARERRDDARKLLAGGIDPGENKKAIKAAGAIRASNSFEVIAREWHGKFSPGWAATHSNKIIRRLEMEIFPWIGGRPIAEITAPELLACIRRIEARGILETAHRTLQHCGHETCHLWVRLFLCYWLNTHTHVLHFVVCLEFKGAKDGYC